MIPGIAHERRQRRAGMLLYHTIAPIKNHRIPEPSSGIRQRQFTRSLEAKHLVINLSQLTHTHTQIYSCFSKNFRHEKHLAFHQKYREKFSPDESVSNIPLPVYFGNVCLRFIPVLDIVIHRFLEMLVNTVNKTLEVILEHLGCLYKFHGEYEFNNQHTYCTLFLNLTFIR